MTGSPSDANFTRQPKCTGAPLASVMATPDYIAGSWSAEAGRQRRVYQLTAAGPGALSGKRADWRDFAAMMSAALEGRPCPDPA